MSDQPRRRRLLVFIVAYEAEATIEQVLRRIPTALGTLAEVEILVIDDASTDRTVALAEAMAQAGRLPFPLEVRSNPVNQGYGGNQKVGFRLAIERGFDHVALVHGDGQYAPELLPTLVQPLLDGTADAVIGSRLMTRGGARRGGMPLYKRVGNRVLTALQNRLLGARLSEYHSGYRLYSIAALKRIPFGLATDGFHFDTETIIQLLIAGQRIVELPIPTFYGDEISRVDNLSYAWNVLRSSFLARAQTLGLAHDPKFDPRGGA